MIKLNVPETERMSTELKAAGWIHKHLARIWPLNKRFPLDIRQSAERATGLKHMEKGCVKGFVRRTTTKGLNVFNRNG